MAHFKHLKAELIGSAMTSLHEIDNFFSNWNLSNLGDMTKRINVRKAFTYLLYSIVHCKEFMVEMNWLRNFPVGFSPQKVIQIRLYARKN